MKRLMLMLLVTASAMAAEPVTLDQAIAMALENNANVRNAGAEVTKGETRVAAARTHRLPSVNFDIVGGEALNKLSLTIHEGELGDYGTTGPLPDHDVRLDLARTFSMFGVTRVTQPITQLHTINLGIKMQEASLAIDKENERAARIAVRREVKSAYFAVLSAQSYAAATQDAVTAWEEVDREMTVRVANKAALEADRLDAVARLAATRAAALSASNTLATAKDQLAYLVGHDIDVVLPALDAPLLSKDANDAFIARRPDVHAAELQVDQAKLDVRRKEAERIPDVAITVSNATPFNNDNLLRNMTSAGITMSYEPFTWGRRSAELKEKQHAVIQAETSLRDKRALANLEISAYARKVEESAAQIAVRRLESEAARERLRVTKTRFEQQAARPDEMFHASATLTQAAAQEQQAISAYWTARADYEKAIGEE
jgi:outer membrane protein TolC